MKKLKWSLLIMIIAVSALIQACGTGGGGNNGVSNGEEAGTNSPKEGKVKIKWATWGNPGELTRFQDFTNDFNKKHPEIEAELIPIPGSTIKKS